MDTSLSIGKVMKKVLEPVMPTKVFPLIAPAKTTYPFIIFRRSSVNPTCNKDYICNDAARVEVIVAAVDYAESIEIAEKVREALEHKRGKFGDLIINDITLETADESFLSDAFI